MMGGPKASNTYNQTPDRLYAVNVVPADRCGVDARGRRSCGTSAVGTGCQCRPDGLKGVGTSEGQRGWQQGASCVHNGFSRPSGHSEVSRDHGPPLKLRNVRACACPWWFGPLEPWAETLPAGYGVSSLLATPMFLLMPVFPMNRSSNAKTRSVALGPAMIVPGKLPPRVDH